MLFVSTGPLANVVLTMSCCPLVHFIFWTKVIPFPRVQLEDTQTVSFCVLNGYGAFRFGPPSIMAVHRLFSSAQHKNYEL